MLIKIIFMTEANQFPSQLPNDRNNLSSQENSEVFLDLELSETDLENRLNIIPEKVFQSIKSFSPLETLRYQGTGLDPNLLVVNFIANLEEQLTGSFKNQFENFVYSVILSIFLEELMVDFGKDTLYINLIKQVYSSNNIGDIGYTGKNREFLG
jgi:hypothetical protein